MNKIGERIKAARERLGLSRSALADQAGIAYPTLAGIENGDQRGTTKLPAIATALNVDATWLLTGKGSMQPPQAPDPSDSWSDVPAYAQAVGLGAGTEAQEYSEATSLKFKKSSLRRKGLLNKRLSVYYGRGDSMEPRIRDGDAILFDEDDTRPEHGAIFIVLWRGEVYAKRIKVADDLILVESDNPNGDHQWDRPKRLDNPKDPVTIVGRVRWIGSWE
ncbi:XRE family transcriptional regulator [Stenotrophomonas maltophilia]|uniref:XRE family transcriptional regulator n=1 Tax=Stenotrophomonas maltophilia TaxID=40324 RepID=UPI001FA6D5DF|nr:S24 family peptidase [Stenotrophomonas maltophilia]